MNISPRFWVLLAATGGDIMKYWSERILSSLFFAFLVLIKSPSMPLVLPSWLSTWVLLSYLCSAPRPITWFPLLHYTLVLHLFYSFSGSSWSKSQNDVYMIIYKIRMQIRIRHKRWRAEFDGQHHFDGMTHYSFLVIFKDPHFTIPHIDCYKSENCKRPSQCCFIHSGQEDMFPL